MGILDRFLKRSGFLGLDLGSYSLKLAEAQQSGSSIVITNFGQIRLPEGVVNVGIVQNEQVFLNSLNTLLSNFSPRFKLVNLGLYAYTTFYERVPLILSEGQDFQEAVVSEIETFIPFDMEDIYYDYVPFLPSGEEQMSIIFATTQKEYINGLINLFSKSPLEINAIDVDVFALSNLWEYLYGPAKRLIVDIGYTRSLAAFIDEYGPIFSREIDLGTSWITTNLMQNLDLSREEAERLSMNIPEDEKGYAVKEVYSEFFRNFLEELENSLEIFKAKFYTPPQEVYFIGGGALVPNLDRFFKENLKLDVRIHSFKDRLSFSSDFDENYIELINKIGAFAIAQAIREFIG